MKQRVVISGGGNGLGLTLVEKYLKKGHYVATFTRNKNLSLEALKKQYADHLYVSEFDNCDINSLKEFVRNVKKNFSRIDVLINNVGYLHEGLQIFTSDNEIKKTLDTNVISPFIMIREISGFMVKQKDGVIINISSINSIKGHKGVSLYSLSKAAMDSVTRSLAKELGPLNVRVNSVVPGFFDSNLVASVNQERRAGILKRTALPRLGTSDDVANAVLFLTSCEASFITGQSIVVDGGITC